MPGAFDLHKMASKYLPRVCEKKKQCKYERCKLQQIAGTKRTKKTEPEDKQNSDIKISKKGNTQTQLSAHNFLGMMESWKNELMEQIEGRIQTLQREMSMYPPVTRTL